MPIKTARLSLLAERRRLALVLGGIVAFCAVVLPACGDGGTTQPEPADFSIEKSGVVSGQTITYTVTVANSGDAGYGVTITDVVTSAPQGSQFTSATGGNCTATSSIGYSCNVTVPGNSSQQLTLVFTVPAGITGEVVNCATVIFSGDTDPDNDEDCVGNSVIAAPNLGTITITKDAQPNAPTDFSFTSDKAAIPGFVLDDDADPTRSNSSTFANIPGDTYVITEAALAGWSLSDIVCTPSAAATRNLGARSVTIVLTHGATVSCNFINAELAPTVVSVTPTSPTGSATSQPITINGTNFATGATVTLRDLITPQSFPNQTIGSQTSTAIVINPVFGVYSTSRNWSAEVINPGGTSSGQTNFVVQAPTPAITTMTTTPTTPTTSGSTILTITGVNFSPTESRIALTGPDCGACAIENGALTTKTSTVLVGSLMLRAPGTYTVRVQNGAGGAGGPGGPQSIGMNLNVTGASFITLSPVGDREARPAR